MERVHCNASCRVCSLLRTSPGDNLRLYLLGAPAKVIRAIVRILMFPNAHLNNTRDFSNEASSSELAAELAPHPMPLGASEAQKMLELHLSHYLRG